MPGKSSHSESVETERATAGLRVEVVGIEDLGIAGLGEQRGREFLGQDSGGRGDGVGAVHEALKQAAVDRVIRIAQSPRAANESPGAIGNTRGLAPPDPEANGFPVVDVEEDRGPALTALSQRDPERAGLGFDREQDVRAPGTAAACEEALAKQTVKRPHRESGRRFGVDFTALDRRATDLDFVTELRSHQRQRVGAAHPARRDVGDQHSDAHARSAPQSRHEVLAVAFGQLHLEQTRQSRSEIRDGDGALDASRTDSGTDGQEQPLRPVVPGSAARYVPCTSPVLDE